MKTRLSIAVLLLAMAAGSVQAQAQADKRRPPSFTKSERAVIARNHALARIVSTDPWIVRAALDVFGKTNTQPKDARGTNKMFKPEESDQGPDSAKYNPARNPDIERLNRSSPEAAHDLFQLLKQAGAQRREAK